MSELQWCLDELTAYWARRVPLPIHLDQQPQYDGSAQLLTESTWGKHILQSQFPAYCYASGSERLLPSPSNIMQCFQENRVLEALALTVAWGGMTRTKGRIYTTSLPAIEHTLRGCLQVVRKNESVEGAWNILVWNLSWSDVITSKVLHFLARSLDYEANAPVPIDTKVILQQVWPTFKAKIMNQRQPNDPPLPGEWRDSQMSWQAYNRYMTAMICWSHHMGWTTTELENTIFKEYYPSP